MHLLNSLRMAKMVPPQTLESIVAAKQQQLAERREVERVARVRFVGDEMVPVPPKFIYHCTRPGCRYRAIAQREWQAVRSLGAHLIKVHLEDGK